MTITEGGSKAFPVWLKEDSIPVGDPLTQTIPDLKVWAGLIGHVFLFVESITT